MAHWIDGYGYDWGTCSHCTHLMRKSAEECPTCGEGITSDDPADIADYEAEFGQPETWEDPG